MYKAVFLDFYGTLVHEDNKVIAEITKEISENSPLDAKPHEIDSFWWKSFSALCSNSHGKTFQTQRVIEQISLNDTLLQYKCDLDSQILSQKLFDYWQYPTVFDDTKTFINKCNLPIYVLSNIDRTDIITAIKYNNLNLSDVITSEDVSSYKPRAEMFLRALDCYKLLTSEVLHIGDSLTSDIKGAQDSGIKACWVNRKHKEVKGGINPDYLMENLMGIFEIL
jgi:2-haloalkanoic acid dehalogenase type II